MNKYIKKEAFWKLIPVVGAFIFTTLLLILFGAEPAEAYGAVWRGAFGTEDKILSVLAFWIPLLLASIGLLITFTAGLWNIGIEGQFVLGSIAASAVALHVEAPTWAMITMELLAAMAAGGLWAVLVAVLKTRGKVHEIFGGLALTNLAIILTNYLISGPWQPPEGGSFRGTTPFPEFALLPRYAESRFSLLSFVLMLMSLGIVLVILNNTRWGLKLKALGKNSYSAFLLGVSSERETILAMFFCGALAGLGGAVRVLSWFDSLRQSISGGIGYLALLVVMLSVYRGVLVPFVALFFSAILIGSISLQIKTQLHPSLGGILMGVLVLLVLLFGDGSKFGFGRRKSDIDE